MESSGLGDKSDPDHSSLQGKRSTASSAAQQSQVGEPSQFSTYIPESAQAEQYLSPVQRKIFCLRANKLATAEIAKELGVSESTVRSQEYRIRSKLSRYMPHAERQLPQGIRDRQGWALGSFIDQIPHADRAGLLRSGMPVRFEDNQILMVQGQVSDCIYILTSGFVKDIVAAAGGAETLVAIRSRGDLVGETALLDGGPHMVTNRAVGPVTALRITGLDFLEIIEQFPAIQGAVTRYIVSQIRASYKNHAAERTLDARERVVQVLNELAKVHGEGGLDGTVRLPITQSELGELAGVAASTTERVLNDIREQGTVITGYREILIQDATHINQI